MLTKQDNEMKNEKSDFYLSHLFNIVKVVPLFSVDAFGVHHLARFVFSVNVSPRFLLQSILMF